MVEKNEGACGSREEDGNPQMQRVRRLLVIFERKKMGKRGGERRARGRRERWKEG